MDFQVGVLEQSILIHHIRVSPWVRPDVCETEPTTAYQAFDCCELIIARERPGHLALASSYCWISGLRWRNKNRIRSALRRRSSNCDTDRGKSRYSFHEIYGGYQTRD